MLVRNLHWPPDVYLRSRVAVGIEHVDERHTRAEERRATLHIRSHGNTGWREIHREEDTCDQPHPGLQKEPTYTIEIH